ncbi:phage regulatory CII family protein [Acinetobacter modestus]|uniref:phage regulatory CII family protein n=1 Tax=Acinetobacter modestus TaxID=1776740 RepID=UPI003016511D
MSEITLSKEAKIALNAMINQSGDIEPKEIAQVLGVSHKTVLNYANPNMDQHLPSLKAVEAIMTYTGNTALIKAWAHKFGFICIPAKQNDNEHQMSVLECLLGMNISNGQMNQSIHNIMSDGIVTPEELNDADLILEELESKIKSIRAALNKECSKYLSALQTKKA